MPYSGETIMSNEITMPKLSDTMEEGKILRWLKHPGDKVARGEALAEVETDKADMVLESFDEGVLDQIKLKRRRKRAGRRRDRDDPRHRRSATNSTPRPHGEVPLRTRNSRAADSQGRPCQNRDGQTPSA